MKSDFISFSIASCNVLYQAYYIQYVSSNPVPIKERCAYFRKALYDQTAFSGADILCFQEWPYNQGILRSQFEMDKLTIDNTPITKKEYFEHDASLQPRSFMAALKKTFPVLIFYKVVLTILLKTSLKIEKVNLNIVILTTVYLNSLQKQL